MNGISENPFFFFVDNAHSMFPMDVYQDVGKIIELSDTGCDAISPSSSIEQKNDEKRETNREKRNTKSNTLPKDKTFPRKVKTKEFTKERSKMINSKVNEKIDQWERNIADFENTLLRDQRNFASDSSWIENDVIDPDLIFLNVPNYSMNTEPNLKNRSEENETRRNISDEKGNKKQRISSASRPPPKQKENKSQIVSNDVTENAKTSRKDKLKDFNDGKRKMIDRAVDKDSLSNNSDVFGIIEENMKNNMENVNKKESNDEKLGENFNRQRFNRKINNKTISKSADFDKSKHRANMLKRYPNKSWIKLSTNNLNTNNSSTIPKNQEKQTFLDNKHLNNTSFVNNNNNNSRRKIISNSARSPSSRRLEKIQKEMIKQEEKINMASSFDDNSDAWNKTNNLINRSKNTNRVSGNSLGRSVRRERENNKVDIEKKDLEKIGAIFLASSLRKSGKLENSSKANDNDDRNSKNNKSDQLETNKMEKGLSKIEKSIKSRIPIAISRMKQKFEDNVDYFKLQDYNRSRSKLRSRSIVTETDRFDENKIDESTSTAIILVDKSDCTRDENNEKDDKDGMRLNSFRTKLEESRKRKMDVESKVFKMANDVKERRRQTFEKCVSREPFKKFPNESHEIVDIAVTILEKNTKGKTKSSNDDRRLKNNDRNHKEIYSKPYSLRSGMYSKYLHNK
ncbi:myb-like protein I [Polistes fuscatus]|uniref:myb-like protein I n=1 Tax=Polistes fuscatus TaxID=30207 RepID=UPI001CA940F4|nr:myb-like protein I [Polistes fuscatus]